MSVDGKSDPLTTELRTVLTRLVKKLRSKSPTRDKFSLTERGVVKLLHEHEHLLPSELARAEKVTTQSMSQILNRLHEMGYIVRKPSATDRRKIMISLTEAGEAIVTSVKNEGDEWLASAVVRTCTTADKEILQRALEPLKKILEAD